MWRNSVQKEYIEWLRNNDKIQYELTDVYCLNEDNTVRIEKKMAHVGYNSPDNWREFCKDTNREYEGTAMLLALY